MDIQNGDGNSGNGLTLANNDIRQFIFAQSKMTRKEVTQAVRLYHACDMMRRQLLLSMYERAAHTAMGIPWETFCADFLDIAEGKYAYELLEWARVERSVLGVSESAAADSFKIKLPRSAARLIGKLPPEKWKAVYEEYQMRDRFGNRTPDDLLTELKRIVKREQSPQESAAADSTTHLPASTPAVEPVRQKPDMKPVVPDTYDRGPEYDDEPIPPDHDGLPPPPITTMEMQLARPDVFPASDPPAQMPTVSEGALLCAAVKLLRQFRYAVKTASQDLIYEADAGAGKFLREYEEADL